LTLHRPPRTYLLRIAVAAACLVVGAVLVTRLVDPASDDAPTYEQLAAELTDISAGAGLPSERIVRQQHTGDSGSNGGTSARLTSLATTDRPDQLFDALLQGLQAKGYRQREVKRDEQLRTTRWDRGRVRITVSVQGLSGRGEQSVPVDIEAEAL
jgi:hypothetical protein